MRQNIARTRGFTMIELLTVIAIIAVLAAILFPVFATIREQARQSSTMSNMQSIYQSVKLYFEDEQRYPTALFGYAQTQENGVNRISRWDDTIFVPMQNTITLNPLYPYLFRDQAKNIQSFFSGDEEVTDRSAVTVAYYPPNSPSGAGSSVDANGVLQGGNLVTWRPDVDNPTGCDLHGDPDMPAPNYAEKAKWFYKMDSMDIGPMIDAAGRWVTLPDMTTKVYALHYTPDWTGFAGAACDINQANQPYVAQLKYKNPPTERTIITYNTHHAAIGNSGRVMVLFLDGRAKKLDLKTALNTFPLNYDL